MRKLILCRCFAAGLIIVSGQTAHAEQCLTPEQNRPSIGLVLGGGGARGLAHAGVIKALEELRVPVDYIAGTSMGALVGGMMATGMTAEEIGVVATTTDWADVFKDDVDRQDRPFRRKRDDTLGLYAAKIGMSAGGSILPPGAISGQKIDFLLESLMSQRTREEDFDDLPIPFRAVAVDILAAEVVVLEGGRMATAMRASMSLPAIFDPVDTGDKLLVDGGVLMNLPVSVGRDMGADIIIAVEVGAPLDPKDKVKNLFQILYQLTGVVTVVNTRQQIALLDEEDFLLVPPLGPEIGSASFSEGAAAIPVGYQETMKQRDALSVLSLSEAEWAERRSTIQLCSDGPPVIDFVRLDNQSRFKDSIISGRLHVETGKPLDVVALRKDIEEIYSLGFLQSVHYRVIEDGEDTGLEIEVQDDSRGTDFFEYGFSVQASSRDSDFNMRLSFLKTDITNRGAEFRGLVQVGQDLGGLTELYMPFTDSLKFVFVPRIALEQTKQNIFDADGNRVSQLLVAQRVFDLNVGYEFSRNAAVYAGIRVGSGSAEVNIGDPLQDPFDFDRGEYRLLGIYDSLDSRYFPGTGTFFRFEAVRSDRGLGADANFTQYRTAYLRARTYGRHSLLGGFEYDISMDDAIPIQSLYRAGGFPRLSGFEYDSLVGENFGMVFGGYRYQFFQNSLFPSYLGGTIEYGNVSRTRNAIFSDAVLNGSVYLGIDSVIGPVYLGVGAAAGGHYSSFLSIGSIFIGDNLIQ